MHRTLVVFFSTSALSIAANAQAGVLATGDFNGDGFADLAIGAPSEDVAGKSDAGAVNVIYGSSQRLSPDAAVNDQFFHEGSDFFLEALGQDAQFGACLTVGDFNGDGFEDLAIGVPNKRVNAHARAGAVYVISGSAGGLDASTVALWHQDVEDMRGGTKTDDKFGSALAAGDFNDDGFDDLAIGSPNERIGTAEQAGGVAVLFGSASGITAEDNVFLTQASGGIDDDTEFFDHFGAALCAGDFDGDGFDDLAIASPDESIDAQVRAGTVHVLYGDADGLDRSSSQVWHQDVAGIGNRCEDRDGFGAVLASGDFDDDGFDDLVIGVPGEDIDEVIDCGVVHVIYGRFAGLRAGGSQAWEQDDGGVPGGRERDDRFGAALAAGDFNADGFADLAIGVPGERVSQLDNSGATNVLFGGAARLTLDDNQFLHQNVDGVFDLCHEGDRFGTSLAAGDFDGNGRIDLASGVPGEDIGATPVIANAGAVHVLYGTNAGISTGPDQLWHQDSPDVRDNAEDDDALGGIDS